MNLKELVLHFSKLLLIGLLLVILWGCQKPRYNLDIYYAKTCPVCRSLINNVIPHIEDQYGKQIQIHYYDIDEEASIDAYAKTCSLLQDYYADEDSGSVPLIVLDGYFAKVGYDISQQDDMIQAIIHAIEGKEIPSSLNNIYKFKEGQTFH